MRGSHRFLVVAERPLAQRQRYAEGQRRRRTVDQPCAVFERDDGRAVANVSPSVRPPIHLERSAEAVIHDLPGLMSPIASTLDAHFPWFAVCAPLQVELE